MYGPNFFDSRNNAGNYYGRSPYVNQGGYHASYQQGSRRNYNYNYYEQQQHHQQQQYYYEQQQQQQHYYYYQQQQQQKQHQHQHQRQHQHQHQHQHQQQQQKQQRRRVVEVDNKQTESEDTNPAPLSLTSSTSSTSLSHHVRSFDGKTNLDRFLHAVTPIIPKRKLTEVNIKGEAGTRPYYRIRDLWDIFEEWSCYGTGVPFLLFDGYPITQYYVPYLSGIQLYIDPQKSYTSVGSSSSSSDFHSEADFVLKDSFAPHMLMNKNKLPLKEKEPELSGSRGTLVFEYMEKEPPHNRATLGLKASALSGLFPELSKYKSCDLTSSSWICVAWYPIYRVPAGPTLRDLEASFLTLHALSTQPGSFGEAESSSMGARREGVRLPVIGLASYKLKNSIIAPRDPEERRQEHALLESAGKWLRNLHAHLPDYQFFLQRNN